MSAPRAVLISSASGFMSASSRAPIKLRVESLSDEIAGRLAQRA